MAEASPVSQPEFSNHVHHQFPHPELEARLLMEVEGRLIERRRAVDELLGNHEGRLNRHDRFIERMIGGMQVLAALAGGGAVAFLIHLVSHT